MKIYHIIIVAFLIAFSSIASIVVINYFQKATTVGFMAVSRIEIINVRFIVGTDTLPDQLRIAIQNWESQALTITNVSLNGVLPTMINPDPAIIGEGVSDFVTLSFKPNTFVDGGWYNMKLQTTMGPIDGEYIFDAEYSAQHNYDISLPEPFHELLRISQLIVASSIIITLGVIFGLFIYSRFESNRKKSLTIRELATLIGINSNISLLIPIIGKNLYDYSYTWVPNLSPIIGIVSLFFFGYAILHFFELDIEGEKRRAIVFGLLLLISIASAISIFIYVMNKFFTV